LSVELPEAYILSKQMSEELTGKEAATCVLKDCQKFQQLGFINLYSSDFNKLCGGKIQTVVSRGNTIRVKLDNGMNLLLAPEYGGKILYQKKGAAAPAKFHLKVAFRDDTSFTVTLMGMGIIHSLEDGELEKSYVYRRDFSDTASPLDDTGFSFERFSEALLGLNVNLKSALVGKDAIVVGLGNSAFQDMLYRAGIHPKRKASTLNETERKALFDATKFVVSQRIKLGGKYQFFDLYSKQGAYIPAMGPNMNGKNCVVCGSAVEKLSLGGGQVFCCPKCQL
jgi:formamidopyrimidine-DNA glycosylase